MGQFSSAPTRTARDGIAVLDKAMATINLIAHAAQPPTFTDLVQVTGLPKTTVHRLLASLTTAGLVRLDPHDRTYRLGLRWLELAHRVWADFDLRLAAHDEIQRQAEATRETVELGVLDGDHVVVVACVRPDDAGRGAAAGERLPVHASALGKAIAAYLDPAAQHRLLEALTLSALTPATLTTVASLRADLDLARARGYALEDGERGAGLRAVAVPIQDAAGAPLGALGLCGAHDTLEIARLHELAARLMGAARRIAHDARGSAMSITPAPRPATPPPIAIECVVRTRSLLGEGPCWDARERVLHWVDILKPALHRYDPATREDTAQPLATMASLAWPRLRGGLLLAAQNGIVHYDAVRGRGLPFAHPEEARPTHRYNDGTCDRRGRLWIGSLDMGAAPHRGSLFRVDPDGSTQRMDTGFTVANGIAFAPDDKRLYFADSGRRTVYVYDFDLASGTLAHRRPFVELAEHEGIPDGLTVDAEGFVWVAIFDGWSLLRYDPEGRVALRVPLPVPRPTSCCFGGPDLRTLYITSASVRLPEQTLQEAPLSGALFACAPGVAGLPATPFG